METEHGEGRQWKLEGFTCAYSMEQPYACTLHGVTAASCTVELWVCWVHVSCDVVTSVRSYSDPLLLCEAGCGHMYGSARGRQILQFNQQVSR